MYTEVYAAIHRCDTCIDEIDNYPRLRNLLTLFKKVLLYPWLDEIALTDAKFWDSGHIVCSLYVNFVWNENDRCEKISKVSFQCLQNSALSAWWQRSSWDFSHYDNSMPDNSKVCLDLRGIWTIKIREEFQILDVSLKRLRRGLALSKREKSENPEKRVR